MKAKLRVKCSNCGNWNKIEVEKFFLSTSTSKAELKIFLPAYLPMKTENCSKCNQIIAKEKGIIRTKRN